DVQPDKGVASDLGHLSGRQEAVSDAALIEHLDRAGVEATGPGANELLGGPPFDNGDIDSGQCQLARQHQSGRASASDDYGMVRHASPLLDPAFGPEPRRRAP